MRAYIQIVLFLVGMFNIYTFKDIGKTVDNFDSTSDLRQTINFSSFLCGINLSRPQPEKLERGHNDEQLYFPK